MKAQYSSGLFILLLLGTALSGCNASGSNAPKMTKEDKTNFKGAPATPEQRTAHFAKMKEDWQKKHPDQVLAGPDGPPPQAIPTKK